MHRRLRLGKNEQKGRRGFFYFRRAVGSTSFIRFYLFVSEWLRQSTENRCTLPLSFLSVLLRQFLRIAVDTGFQAAPGLFRVITLVSDCSNELITRNLTTERYPATTETRSGKENSLREREREKGRERRREKIPNCTIVRRVEGICGGVVQIPTCCLLLGVTGNVRLESSAARRISYGRKVPRPEETPSFLSFLSSFICAPLIHAPFPLGSLFTRKHTELSFILGTVARSCYT